ncbi:MAG: hypothetical protein OWR62_12590 [Sulfobacillus thermotolerans]|uniref:Jacalin-type lectin domain-containing protein n=1 Tax=Sulfobacillus thermotolerans TaxID=338644 RepID=A0ABM6RSX5_9FIRM|nr:hypothetical protein BXT84_10985 [Sulfobacillus thermotolerans]MCY0909215.1 hypothetical protein [Sulfobacillus thermotolerans]
MSIYAPMIIIGGRGGTPFQDFAPDGKMIEKLGVWIGGWQIKALRIWRTNEPSKTFGEPGGPYNEFTFEPGERITQMSLWGNGAGTRLGWIYFKTSHNRVFDFGMNDWGRRQEYPVDVGSGICIGCQGRSGSDIDAGGFVFLDHIRSAVIKNLHYPTLSFDTSGITPVRVDTFHRKNTSAVPEQWKFSGVRKETASETWATTVGIEAYMEVNVEAGIPEVGKEGVKYGWKLSATSSHQRTSSIEVDRGWELSGTLPPGQEISLEAIMRRGSLPSLAYTGQMEVTMQSGEVFTFPVNGNYAGVVYSGIDVVDQSTGEAPGVLRADTPMPPEATAAINEMVEVSQA